MYYLFTIFGLTDICNIDVHRTLALSRKIIFIFIHYQTKSQALKKIVMEIEKSFFFKMMQTKKYKPLSSVCGRRIGTVRSRVRFPRGIRILMHPYARWM